MSGLHDPPYENGHNFWTGAPITKIQTILKSEKAGLQHILILEELIFLTLIPPPLALTTIFDKNCFTQHSMLDDLWAAIIKKNMR